MSSEDTINNTAINTIINLHKELGIPDSYRKNNIIPLQIEATDLVDSEVDIFSRNQKMTAETLGCWHQMKEAALLDDVVLHLISAFRSMEYQKTLIQNKLHKGQAIEGILTVNAAPGYSEHHTGRALDIGTTNCPPLTEEFETTNAFRWLAGNAKKYSFSLSYPRNNPYGIDYEPWHWACDSQE